MLGLSKHAAVFLRNFEMHSSVPSPSTSSNICMRAAADEERDEAGGGNIFDQSGRRKWVTCFAQEVNLDCLPQSGTSSQNNEYLMHDF